MSLYNQAVVGLRVYPQLARLLQALSRRSIPVRRVQPRERRAEPKVCLRPIRLPTHRLTPSLGRRLRHVRPQQRKGLIRAESGVLRRVCRRRSI